MKHFYSIFAALIAAFLLTSTTTFAQSTTGKVYVGYAQQDDQIWEYDGLSLDFDATVGCAILLTEDMVKPYAGGTIVGMLVGWDTTEEKGTYNGFVRNDFNGEDLSTGTATVSYSYTSSNPGWNTMNMSKYKIPEDVGQLVVGFTTKLKAGLIAIPKLYPNNVAHSCYLWVDGDNDKDGNPIWRDARDFGKLPILLIIQDTSGTFNYVPVVTSLVDNGIYVNNEVGDCLIRVKNAGSMAINNMEVTTRQGDETFSKTFVLKSAINPGKTTSPFLAPFSCFHSGDVEFSITKVNNKEVSNPQTFNVNVIGIPQDVSKNYVRRPLVEYYESENNYMSPRYFDEIVQQNILGLTDDMTLVCQHLDDQFMNGDDDATRLSLLLCDNDSFRVSIPAMTIDRAKATDNISYQMASASTPMFSVLYEPYGSTAMKASMTRPTFANVDTYGYWDEDGETLHIRVNGELAEGVLPEGENAKLTVYLMERFVDSDSQIFWTDDEKEEHMGHYTHYNIIREILTDYAGDEINGQGQFHTSYTTYLDPTWKKDDLYLVAFVHRNGEKGGNYMHVFNSTEGVIDELEGISAPNLSTNTQTKQVYDLSGRRVVSPQKGIYIANGKKVFIK